MILGVGFNQCHQKVNEICHSEDLDNPANIHILIFSKVGVREERKGDKVHKLYARKKNLSKLTSISDKIKNKKILLS